MKSIHTTLFIVIIATLSLGSLCPAENAPRTRKQPDPETEALNTAAATALVMESYRLVQSTMIEAEFQKHVRASTRFGDSSLATDIVRLAAKKRDKQLQELEAQLANIRAAYYASAISTTNNLPVRLDKAAATTRLREIAASSQTADLDPQQKVLVKAILHPTTSRAALASAMENLRDYSVRLWSLAGAAAIAGQVEIYYSGLALLTVAAVLVIHRMTARVTPGRVEQD